MTDPPKKQSAPPAATGDLERQLRDMNEALLVSSVQQHELTEKAEKSETKLRGSEEKYRALFNAIDEGVCTIEILTGDDGKPRDYRFLEYNPMFEELTGLADATGKTALELVPDLEDFWVETYGRVAMTGESIRFENYSEPMNRWFDVFASRIGDEPSRTVALVFRNITDIRRAETNLICLSEVNQALAGLTGIDEMMQTVGARIGKYLDLSICAFIEVNEAKDEAAINYAWHRKGAIDVVGVYRFSEYLTDDFARAGRAGHEFVVHDTTADPRTDTTQYAALKIGAFLSVPIIEDGEWKFSLVAYHSNPHHWAPDEIELIRSLTNHIWTRLGRARGEAALRESEEKFRDLADNMSQFAWTADANGWIYWYNQRWFDYTGTTLEEMQGWGWKKVHHPDHVDRVVEKIQLSWDTGDPWEDTFPLRSKDGEYRWFLSRALPIRDEDGKIVRWFGTNTDIHEDRQTRLALTESEQRFSKAFNSSPLSFTVTSMKTGRLVEVNDTWVDLTGYSREEAIGKTTNELGLWKTPSDRAEELDRLAREGQVRNAEYTFLTKNGTEFAGLLSAEIIEIDGEPCALSVIQDITSRKKAQESLLAAERHSTEEYQKLLSRIVPLAETLGRARSLVTIYRSVCGFIRMSMPCSGFFVSFFDPATSLRTAAFAWGEEGEVDVSELPPIKLTENGGPNSQAVFQKRTVVVDRYMEAMNGGPHYILQDNGKNPISAVAVPMTVMNRVIGTIEVQAYEPNAFGREQTIALEMTANLAAVAIENVRLIETEASARAEAEAANRAKDEFLSVLSHELRTPLNAMLGWVRMLRSGVLDKENAGKAYEVIERNTRLQSSLIEDLLDVSRIISGKMRIETELADLVTLVKTVSETIDPLAVAKGVTYKYASEPEVIFLNADGVRIQQVISNLLQNAIKFTPEGGHVSLSIQLDGDNAVMTVADTGVGIDEEFLPHIFDRFSQADASTRRNYAGLGLGLTIVRTIVEMHGGEIAVKSEGVNKGSVFTVTLPVAQEFYAGNGSNKELPRKPNYADELSGVKILLVDDNPDSLAALALFLKGQRAEVTSAASAVEALRKLSENDFHIMVSDIAMPGMDGYELIKATLADDGRNASVKSIALTAYASSDDRDRALAAGFHAHLPKPVDFDELLKVLARFYMNGK